MMITPEYCRVDRNHLHTFRLWQGHLSSAPLILLQVILLSPVTKCIQSTGFRSISLASSLVVRPAPLPLLLLLLQVCRLAHVIYGSMRLYCFADINASLRPIITLIQNPRTFTLCVHTHTAGLPPIRSIPSAIPLLHTVSFLR